MKETVNQRIMKFIKLHDLGDREFCEYTKMSRNTLKNIENGGNVQDRTIRVICEKLGASREYLLHGKEPMEVVNFSMYRDAKEEHINYTLKNFPITEKALALLEQQLKRKDEQITSLLAVISKLNFLKAVNGTDSQESEALMKVA